MEDERIIDLYWQRDERAITATKETYGRYCYAIAYRILASHEEAEECENDTYLDAWNSIPPARPQPLSAFLGMLSRRIALDRWRKGQAKKRGGDRVLLSLDELAECLPGEAAPDAGIEAKELAAHISAFLRSRPRAEGDIFLRRYWFLDSIKEIATRYNMGESRVKMLLKRTRERLMTYLTEREVTI
ncbi:MAG: RNA polymerase sigma factor [Clostridia bacterium]|nr:RNA polymerase sigma factor [Clostridia bacterium]